MDNTTDQTPFWLAWRKTCSIRKCSSQEALARHNTLCGVPAEKQLAMGKTEVVYRTEAGAEHREYIYPEPVGPEDLVDESAFEDIVKLARAIDGSVNKRFSDMIRTPRTPKAFQTLFKVKRAPGDISESEAQILDEHDAVVQEEINNQMPGPVGRRAIEGVKQLTDFGDLSDVNDDSLTNEDDLESEAAACARSARVKVVSEYRDYVESWKVYDPNVASAFELLETFLYSGNGKKARGSDAAAPEAIGSHEWHGRKLKSYLFEVIGARSGEDGLCKNLWGYLLGDAGVLRTMARESFRHPIYESEPSVPPQGRESEEQYETVYARELASYLRQWLVMRWPRYNLDDRLAICCALLFEKPSDPVILAESTLSRTGFDNRRAKLLKELGVALLKWTPSDGLSQQKGGSAGLGKDVGQWLSVFRDLAPDIVRDIVRERAERPHASAGDVTCARLFLKGVS